MKGEECVAKVVAALKEVPSVLIVSPDSYSPPPGEEKGK